LDGRFGIGKVCLSLPAIVNRSGVVMTLDVPMSTTELGLLKASADAVRAVAGALGL
jgi:L-lactate dehydrogenase